MTTATDLPATHPLKRSTSSSSAATAAPAPDDGLDDAEGGRAPQLFGLEAPRIFTKPLRPLTPETSNGFACIDFAERVLRVQLYPWQRWLLIHALELLEGGGYRFETVLVLVSRQNGKTLVMTLLALWRMFLDDAKLVIGTAQKLDVAKEAWQAAVDLGNATPVLASQMDRVVGSHGEEALLLKKDRRPGRGGERYKVAAANRRGGRGLSGDLVLLDELREHQDWQAWGAVTNTTMATARSMVWCFSNAGDATSVVLRALRRMALWAPGVHGGDEDRELAEWQPDDQPDDGGEDGDDADLDEDSTAIFEWSATPGRSKWDRRSWVQANPSLGWNPAMTVRKLRGKLKMPDHTCRPENLCEWTTSGGLSAFGQQAWDRAGDPGTMIADDSPLRLCIDLSESRATASIAVAGARPDGVWTGMIAARSAGVDWVRPWLKARLRKGGTMHGRAVALTLQTNGAPVSVMVTAVDGLRTLCDKYGVEFVDWSGSDLGRACGSAYDLVQGRKVWQVDEHGATVVDALGEPLVDRVEPLVYHPGTAQPVLSLAASMARTRKAGDSWIFDRTSSDVDIAPLMAWVGALWLCTHHKVTAPLRSAYEDAEPIWL